MLDPALPAGYRLLAVFEDAYLVEPRTSHRGGPRVQTVVNREGTVRITDHGVMFVCSVKSTQWRFDKLVHTKAGYDHVTFHVSNRQLISGVGVGANRQSALVVALRWGLSLHHDNGFADILSQARKLEQDDAAALADLVKEPVQGT